jgi:alkaline phosphatase D
MSQSRRELLAGLASASALALVPSPFRALAAPGTTKDPFSLGVASGAPEPSGVVLWTRLAPEPLVPGGGLDPVPVRVAWEVAEDERFGKVVAKGEVQAGPEWAHSVHVEVTGLGPDRWYFYRFRTGDAVSPVGRTRTAPAADAALASLKFGVASCQHYEQGYFVALRHAAESGLDLFAHVGDYIYESSWGKKRIRSHGAPEPVSLDDYRIRHALYKTDPGLRAAHAAMPWLVTWDDHEVENDYAGPVSENADPEAWFLERRQNAYRAWYEHLPVRRTALPMAGYSRIFGRHAFGTLASFHVLDDRQYRSPQACPRPGRHGSRTVKVEECSDLNDPRRSLLGPLQEAWLLDGLSKAKARWNIVVQQTLVADIDRLPGPGREVWTDGWTGYPESRRRILDRLREAKTPNPMFVGGDVHSFWVTELKSDFLDPASPIVASEFVGSSVTAESGFAQEAADAVVRELPHVKYANMTRHGFLRVDLSPARAEARLVAVLDKFDERSGVEALGTWVVEDGRPAPQRA